MPFGKYKGRPLADLPPQYLSWLRSSVADWPAMERFMRAGEPDAAAGGGGDGGAPPGTEGGGDDGSVHGLFARWGLPRRAADAYARMGIGRLFDWQRECLESTGAMAAGRNLVYGAPTSGGKTAVAEILMLRAALRLRRHAVLVVPFVSIVVEKAAALQRLCEGLDVAVRGYYASSGGALDLASPRPELAVCTIEKGNGLVNRLLEDGRLGAVGCVVVDEAHMVGEPGRGGVLEALVAKVLLASPDTQVAAALRSDPHGVCCRPHSVVAW
jgi:hypothetical protein